MINRRLFLTAAGACGAFAFAGVTLLKGRSTPFFLTAADTQDQGHCLLGLDLTGKPVYCVPVPFRAHDAIAIQDQYALHFARRPGTHCYVVDLQQGNLLKTLTSPEQLHYCGHGIVSDDGLLYLTEYDFVREMGVVGIYEASSPFARLGQMDTYGLDPHQLAFLPGQEVIVLANGGILTHPDSEREMLNLDTMDPSLIYLDRKTGKVLQHIRPPHHQTSLRHLTVTSDGEVIIGAQDHAEHLEESPNPLVYRHRLNGELQALQTSASHWRNMNQYIASVASDPMAQYAVTTTPRGGRVDLWSLQSGEHCQTFQVPDVAGVTWDSHHQAFLVSNGRGQLVYLYLEHTPRLATHQHSPGVYWDNHLASVI